jgi:taurine dioxygenase
MDDVVLDPIGARTTDLSIRDLDSDLIARLTELLARHCVLVMPDQDIDDAAFVTFLERFGELTFTRGETPAPGFPDLNVVSDVGRTTPPRSVASPSAEWVPSSPAR